MKKRSAFSPMLFSFLVVLTLLLSLGTPSAVLGQDGGPSTEDSGEPLAPPQGAGDPAPLFEEEALAACTSVQANWAIKAPLPSGRYGAAVVSDGTYVYAAGGNGDTGQVNEMLRYDPETNSWTPLAPLPEAVSVALGFFVNGKIYVMGGLNTPSTSTNSLQIYTISSNTWESGTAMPGTRQQMGGGYHNGKIYAVGGYETDTTTSAQNQTWAYTIASNSWASLAPMPASLAGPGSGVVNGVLYILGGRNAAGSVLNTVYRYNVAGNTWDTGAPMPVAANYPGSTVFDSRIWVFGGGQPFLSPIQSPEEPLLTNTQIYEPQSNTWSDGTPLGVSRSFVGAAVLGYQIFAVGGWSESGYSPVVEAYTQAPLKILIVYSDLHVIPNRLRFSLMARPEVSQVDVFDAQSSTPTLQQLKYYNIVISFSNSAFANAATMGDNLADYADSGGVVIPMTFAFYNSIHLTGRWATGGYSPFNLANSVAFSTATLEAYTPSHPLMQGVSTLSAYHRVSTTGAAGASVVAYWSDGLPLIAAKGRAVAINAYIGDFNGEWSGDFTRVIVNAGRWLGNSSCENLTCTAGRLFQGAITAGDPTQTNRVTRSNPASTCASPQVCEITASSSVHYDKYELLNNSGSEQCVTVALDGTGCGATYRLQTAAYLGAYNPGSLCTGYLGDFGASPEYQKSYSFSVPAWETYTVVVNETVANGYCAAYTLEVSARACPIRRVSLPAVLR